MNAKAGPRTAGTVDPLHQSSCLSTGYNRSGIPELVL